MIKTHFQRQGVGTGFRLSARNVWAEVHYIEAMTTKTRPRITTPAGYNIKMVAVTAAPEDKRFNDYEVISHVWQPNERPTTFAELCTHVEQQLAAYFGESAEVGRFVEASSYYSDTAKQIWPHITNDIYVDVQAVYDSHSDTIRKVPENQCLIAWFDNPGTPAHPRFGGNSQWRDLAIKAHAEFAKSHNQRNSDRANKEWLAWLLSEWIKAAQAQMSALT